MIVLALGCTSSGTPADADAPWSDVDPDMAEALEEGLADAYAEQGMPGAALAVAFPGSRQRWVGTVGVADLDSGAPWELDTPYPIGSVTKTFTAAIVMQLVEEGTLELDDPIERWVETPWGGRGITLRNLMQHTSGIVSYNYVGDFDTSARYTPQQLVDWAADHGPDLLFEPGTHWDYSNTNYVLLGMTIEAATQRTYEAELDERLLAPLHLDATRLATTNPDDLVRGYVGDPLEDDTDGGQPSVGWAAGGIIGTPADLVTWGAALFAGDVLTEESLSLLETPLVLDGQPDLEVGLGLFGNDDEEFGPYWGHTGGTGGHLTYLYDLRRSDAVVVAMVNSFEADLDALAGAAWLPIIEGP
ncbi:MAG: beta-lactamase family protein [Myxococcales bacterium]|nr:beta-lactamase family protein [Myxococcales bacterium]